MRVMFHPKAVDGRYAIIKSYQKPQKVEGKRIAILLRSRNSGIRAKVANALDNPEGSERYAARPKHFAVQTAWDFAR